VKERQGRQKKNVGHIGGKRGRIKGEGMAKKDADSAITQEAQLLADDLT